MQCSVRNAAEHVVRFFEPRQASTTTGVREYRVLDFKRVRPLDVAIAAIAVVVVVLGAWLGYSVWASRQAVKASAPVTRAIIELEANVRKAPNDFNARMRLAQAYAVAGRDRDAQEQYEAILAVNDQFVPAISGIGFLALTQQDWEQGEKYYRRIIELIKNDLPTGGEDTLETAYFYLGTALYEQGNYEEAAANFKEALILKRDAADVHYALAVAYRAMGSDKAFRKSLENALLFDPKLPEANFDLGEILLAEGDVAQAAEKFRISADAAPNVDKPRLALEELGSFDERFSKAKELMSTDPKAALVEARVAAALEPQNAQAQLLAGQGFEESGDRVRAEEMYRRVLLLDPQNAEATQGLERVTDGS